MRPIAPESFIVNLMALCIFPFAVRPMIQAMLGIDDRRFGAVHHPPAPRTCRRSSWERCGHDASLHSAVWPPSAIGAARAGLRADRRPPAANRCSSAALQRDGARRRRAHAGARAARASRPICACATSTSSGCRRSAPSGSRSISPTCPTSPFNGPDGQPVFAAPKFTYDASLRVDQRLYDAAIQPRRDLRARRSRRIAGARAHGAVRAPPGGQRRVLRRRAAAGAARRARPPRSTISTRACSETTTRVREGAALPADAAAIEATLLQQRQQADALRSSRRAALARLSILTGRAIDRRRGDRAARDGRPRSRRPASTLCAAARAPGIRTVRPRPRSRRPPAGGDEGGGSAAGVGVRPRRITAGPG